MPKISLQKSSVLDLFEARSDNWKCPEFHRALEVSMGSRWDNVKDAHSTLLLADRIGRWPRVVEQYVRSHAEGGSVNADLISIAQRLSL